MKKMLKITLLLLLAPFVVLANGGLKGKYTKEKKISKTFNVSPTAALDVNNKYGNVYVTTWDENQTVVDVVIKVAADKQDLLDKRLNSIDVNFSATSAKVSATTAIGNFSGRNVSMEINYTIKIPKKNTIDINNQYGGVKLGKIYGTAILNVQYGNLAIDELNGTKNELKLQYSDAVNIGTIGLSKMNAQYSDVKIERATDELILTSEYTDVRIGSVKRFNLKCSYGDVKAETAHQVSGSGSYSDVRFGTITGMLNYSCIYGDVNVGRIGKDADMVFINGQYSDITLKFDAAWACEFQARASYADVNGLQYFTLQEKKDSGSSKFYKGTYRGGGRAKLTIESGYGDVNLSKI